jgi:hypothetical protein
MAALRCPCPQGSKIWGELWWTESKHRWVFFDDEKTSQTYTQNLTHCPGCERPLARENLTGR